MRWFFLIVLSLYTYEKLKPIAVRTVTVEVVKWKIRECPPLKCPEYKPCEIIYQPPDEVVVVSQDEPCRCSDTY